LSFRRLCHGLLLQRVHAAQPPDGLLIQRDRIPSTLGDFAQSFELGFAGEKGSARLFQIDCHNNAILARHMRRRKITHAAIAFRSSLRANSRDAADCRALPARGLHLAPAVPAPPPTRHIRLSGAASHGFGAAPLLVAGPWRAGYGVVAFGEVGAVGGSSG